MTSFPPSLKLLRPKSRMELHCDGSASIYELVEGTDEYDVIHKFHYKAGTERALRLWSAASPLQPSCVGGCKGHETKAAGIITNIDPEARSVTFG